MKFCDWNVCFWMILLFPHQMPCLMPKFSSSFSSDSPSFLSSTDVLTRDAIHSLVDFRQQTRKEKIVLDENEIRKMFAPRTMTQKNPDEPAGSVGIVRAVKKKAFAGDNDTEVKDFLVDPEEGLIGSQG